MIVVAGKRKCNWALFQSGAQPVQQVAEVRHPGTRLAAGPDASGHGDGQAAVDHAHDRGHQLRALPPVPRAPNQRRICFVSNGCGTSPEPALHRPNSPQSRDFAFALGVTGRKKNLLSVPYDKIAAFEVETAGTADTDGELRIWVSGYDRVIKREFRRNVDVNVIQKLLAYHMK